MPLTLRKAASADLDWVRAQYATANFVPHADTHFQLVAELDGATAGLGRLVPAGAEAVELGGMYVLPGFRGQGLGTAIVAALLAEAAGRRVYCIPFARLTGLYESLGFRIIDEERDLPPEIAAKLTFCRGHYAERVCLMRLEETRVVGA
jgi:GNAT superfamily N-acetyltransferase